MAERWPCRTCSRSTTHMIQRSPISTSRRKEAAWSKRTGLFEQEFDCLVARGGFSRARCTGIDRPFAQAARDASVRMLSHDDETSAMREAFRSQGVGIAEFPVNEETATRGKPKPVISSCSARPMSCAAAATPDGPKASDMIARGLCSILASDYYYPAQILAAFRLAADGVCHLRKPGT